MCFHIFIWFTYSGLKWDQFNCDIGPSGTTGCVGWTTDCAGGAGACTGGTGCIDRGIIGGGWGMGGPQPAISYLFML